MQICVPKHLCVVARACAIGETDLFKQTKEGLKLFQFVNFLVH